MVQELQYTWKKRMDPMLPEHQQWQQFKIFYCTTIKEYDQVGLTTAKPIRANSVVNQETINQQTNSYLENIQDQLDNVTQAMSVMTQSPPASHVPPIIRTHNSNTSALGTTDQSYRLLMEERNKHDRDRAALQNNNSALHRKIRELKASLANTVTTAGSSRSPHSTGGTVPNEKIIHRDNTGSKWLKVAHYCSKHGYNVSHSNQNCRDKHKPGAHGWVDGATATDNKGGNTRNADKHHHWYNPDTKTHAISPPP